MKKEIEVRIKNESPSYSSETVIHTDGVMYKIVAENGNCFSKLNVYKYTQNGDLVLIACWGDIPNYESVNYIWDDTQRLLGNRKNIKAAEEYIKKVF